MCNKSTKNKLLKFFANFCCKVGNKQKETLEEKDKENERKNIEKDKYLKNLRLKDMIEHYNYINEHYIKQHKKWSNDIILNIIIIAEVSAIVVTVILYAINLKEEVCPITLLDFVQTTFTYITVSFPILVLIHTLREERAKIEIEHKEKENKLKWEIIDFANELENNNLLTDENKEILNKTFPNEFSFEKNDKEQSKQNKKDGHVEQGKQNNQNEQDNQTEHNENSK